MSAVKSSLEILNSNIIEVNVINHALQPLGDRKIYGHDLL